MGGLLSLDHKRRVEYRVWLWCYSGRNVAGASLGVMAPDCENGVSLGVITPNCENGVSPAVVTPEEGVRPGSQLVGVVWSLQNGLSRSPPLISSSEVGRGEPPLFRSGCSAGIMKELETSYLWVRLSPYSMGNQLV